MAWPLLKSSHLLGHDNTVFFLTFMEHRPSFTKIPQFESKGRNVLKLQFRIAPAEKCSKADVIAGIDIYCKTVDPGSLTDTNQIKDYIWNHKRHLGEARIMFFYLLYGNDGMVEGFSEFAYLPENRTLVIDYLCTKERNHVLFYNFYHMAVEETERTLKAKGKFVRYIITELSLNKADGILVDPDSNYFRRLLSAEGFRVSKYPYYQPPLDRNGEIKEFSLAFKLSSITGNEMFLLEPAQYISIVKELYLSHYLVWYESFPNGGGIGEIIKGLPGRIEREFPKKHGFEPISLVLCELYEEGQCPKYTAENITLLKEKKRRWGTIGFVAAWIVFSLLTFFLCAVFEKSKAVTITCSVLTIIAGFISIISFGKDSLLPK